jgi:SAM-dependent methyltransferase
VLAQAQGEQGLIRVEERDGLRLLTITDRDGVRTVHAARALSPGMLTEADPVAALAQLNRPPAPSAAPPRALVIGLGSGQTASDLAASGYVVAAVEREPAIIDMARAWFGYQGHAEAAEGLAFLRADRADPYAVIVLDAFQGQALPPAFQTPEAAALLRARLTPGGLLIVRLLATPAAVARSPLISAAGDRFSAVLGSGVGGEPQNILILSSDSPISALLPPSLPLWPVRLPSDLRDAAEDPNSSLSAASAPDGLDATITLLAYLSQAPDGALALDLPHYHMGARRYLLRGPEPVLARLRALLPPDAAFPTAGDIGSDGDLTPTLAHVLGGGGVKRSEVRFSPVVVAARGRASLRAIIGPDHIALQRPPKGAERPADALAIPYGGVLYDLDVTDLLWTLDAPGYEALRRRHISPAIKRALSALSAAHPDLAAAHAALTDGLRAFTDALGPHGDQALAIQELQRLIPAAPTSPTPSAWDAALACDLAQHQRWSPYPYDTVNPDARALGAALALCAMRGYLTAARLPDDRKGHHAALAAARLLWMLDAIDLGSQKPPISARDLQKLLGHFSDPIAPLEHPPTGLLSPF